MPVTAKLSQAFYDRLGHQVAASSLVLEQRLSAFSRLLEQQIAKLGIDLKDQQVVQMRWMIGMWVVGLVAVIGLWVRR